MAVSDILQQSSPRHHNYSVRVRAWGLPSTQLHVCGLDLVRDDSLLYAWTLAVAGADMRVEVYLDIPHGFAGYTPQLQQAAKFREDRKKAFQWLLS